MLEVPVIAPELAQCSAGPDLHEDDVDILAQTSPRSPAQQTLPLSSPDRDGTLRRESWGERSHSIAESDKTPHAVVADDSARVGHIKTPARKKEREFTTLHYCQRLARHTGAVWALSFSHDGTYLASGMCFAH